MKAVFLLVLAFAVWAESANHQRKHRNDVTDAPEEGEATGWPSTQAVFGFEVPDIFTGGFGFGNQETSTKHAKLNPKKRSH